MRFHSITSALGAPRHCRSSHPFHNASQLTLKVLSLGLAFLESLVIGLEVLLHLDLLQTRELTVLSDLIQKFAVLLKSLTVPVAQIRNVRVLQSVPRCHRSNFLRHVLLHRQLHLRHLGLHLDLCIGLTLVHLANLVSHLLPNNMF